MTFLNEVSIHWIILVLGVLGFLVAKHIYNHKRAGQLLVCPIRFDCNTVVNSDYSRFFGIPVEILGMIYYGIVVLSHIPFLFMAESLPAAWVNLPLISSTVAFLFSLYLIYVQIFLLKKGCSWCFVSAFISTLIFFLPFFV